ncbi:MAG: AAA family ATPase [Thiomicrospira sp.]|uniref:bifunctional aminoglycoside phosphotransferase/ATP-binding protein n=1 Tax=Thiomicrospira sp. TaxID=935 RepID=UPI0019F21200|nr:bifunctional aminoglycoside phosphotransferase/ATP-binding protein [Thiomicrospira sp.]MBE0493199.1 AAA family ATPase [Thiomicrospira sp.]
MSITQANQALINWLSYAPNYSDSGEQIQRIETHISCVFLTGQYAYKLKKRVNFGFLDFTQLSQRQHFCEMEVELNRRTAPQLYLSVVPIYQHPEHPDQISWAPQPGLVVADYLVKMNQFDPEMVLSRYLLHTPLSDSQISQLANAIARLHQQAESIPAGDFLGSPACVLEPMTDNFPSLLALLDCPQLKTTQDDFDCQTLRDRLNQLELWTRNQHTLLAPMIEQRQQQGHVRACHGDLHLDNITLINDQPVLFDGIEFNDQFRWIDTLSDLAFLLIDLDFRQKPALALSILNRYLQQTGDYAGLVLLRFYQTYRALVRAKITGLRYQQLDPTSAEARYVLTTMVAYIDLAEHYAYLHQASPTLFIMQGISGSGKSYYAEQIHQQVGALVISSDRERKRLYGIQNTTRVSDAEKSALYSPHMNQATYQALYQACQSALQSGLSVVADATFLQAKHRERFIEMAESAQRPYLIISLEPDADLAEQRIAEREQLNLDPSDADAQVMRRQLDQFEAPLACEHSLSIKMGSELPSLKDYLNQPITPLVKEIIG